MGTLFADGLGDDMNLDNASPWVVTHFGLLLGRGPLRAKFTAEYRERSDECDGDTVNGYLVEHAIGCSLFILAGESPEAEARAHRDLELMSALLAADQDERANIADAEREEDGE